MHIKAEIDLDEGGIFKKMEDVVVASIRLREALGKLEDEMQRISLKEKRDSEESQRN